MAAMPLTPMTPLDGEVEMYSRGMQPLFSIDTALSNRASKLSIVPELESPSASTFLDIPRQGTIDRPRPLSEFTEIFDEIEEDLSEFEEDSEEAYGSLSNEDRRSRSTISTVDEVPTPLSSRRLTFTQNESRRSVEGPRGPHLFRSSTASELGLDYALQLSPIVPKKLDLRIDTAFLSSPIQPTPTTIADAPAAFATTEDQWNKHEPSSWTAGQVSLWMYETGLDSAVVERFEDNDISGKILLDLQFEDLKDIGIESFGKRHEIWNKICNLRAGDDGLSPAATQFQDTSPCDEDPSPTGPRRRRRKYRANPNDPITPMDSVSIVAIEQLIPKPHKCQRGENCPKWRKQQKMLKRLDEEHGFPISPENGGRIYMAGDPGNAFSAPNIVENTYRPVSDAGPSVVGPSVVASSDLLGPGDMPPIALQADSLRQIAERDAQENVKNFLSLQHVDQSQMFAQPHEYESFGNESPLEMFPPVPAVQNVGSPLVGLQALPRLQIPRSSTAIPNGMSAIQDPFSAMRSAAVTPGGMYRFATPASEMDVPITTVPFGPISRDTSQSVPPNMQYRDQTNRSSLRSNWRQPSALPSLNENEVFSPSSDQSSRRTSRQTFGSKDLTAIKDEVPQEEQKHDPRYPGVNHAGWMKKRKTKMLRHEWNEHHFRLTGNVLDMHQNDIPQAAVLESLNIDEYAIACSSIASNKLAAKFKALKIAKDKEKDALKDSAFEFQLVPDQIAKHNKSHHFAVKTRDERIDWMRELMLAKALRAKKDGFDIEVNGNQV